MDAGEMDYVYPYLLDTCEDNEVKYLCSCFYWSSRELYIRSAWLLFVIKKYCDSIID